jgi:hypothetical protein
MAMTFTTATGRSTAITMTSPVARLYTAAVALAAFFLAWAGIAAHPWAHQAPDPRLIALQQREQRLQRDASLVQQLVDQRAAVSRSGPASVRDAPPAVRVVTLPPLATTRSS